MRFNEGTKGYFIIGNIKVVKYCSYASRYTLQACVSGHGESIKSIK